MTKEEAEAKYKEYLDGHIGNVNEALGLISTLGIPFVDENLETLKDICKDHDKSKWEEPEWTPYLHHFYPTNEVEEMESEAFEVACRHHIKNNKHHWDYWVDDENNLIPDIDENEYKLYTVERCCDWLAMANQHGEKPTEWYSVNKSGIVMPQYGYDLTEEILNKIPEDKFKLSYTDTRGELDEDLYLNQDVVSKLGDRVKKSKTSNTIEIDTSMTNHDKQLKEEMTADERKKVLMDLVNDADKEGVDDIMYQLSQIDYIPDNKKRGGKRFIIDTIRNCYDSDSKNIENAICNALHKDTFEYLDRNEKEVLDEAKLAQIKQKSKNQDPERIERSKKVKSTYLGMSKFGILNFKTTSQSRNGHHYQTVEFKDMGFFEDIIKEGREVTPQDIKEAVKKQDVNVWCTDESFTYWAWGHLAYINDFLYIDDRIPDLKTRIQAPKVNNVDLNGGSCKHILSVIDYLNTPFVLLKVAQDMNKYLASNKEQSPELRKQTTATQNQYDQVADWDWSEIEKYTGLSKAQILSDISKTLQVIPSIDREDAILDIFAEVIPSESQGLKRKLVDRTVELIDDNDNENKK